eukprot:XP_008664251.1 proline-rich protein 36-like [Zea mays]
MVNGSREHGRELTAEREHGRELTAERESPWREIAKRAPPLEIEDDHAAGRRGSQEKLMARLAVPWDEAHKRNFQEIRAPRDILGSADSHRSPTSCPLLSPPSSLSSLLPSFDSTPLPDAPSLALPPPPAPARRVAPVLPATPRSAACSPHHPHLDVTSDLLGFRVLRLTPNPAAAARAEASSSQCSPPQPHRVSGSPPCFWRPRAPAARAPVLPRRALLLRRTEETQSQAQGLRQPQALLADSDGDEVPTAKPGPKKQESAATARGAAKKPAGKAAAPFAVYFVPSREPIPALPFATPAAQQVPLLLPNLFASRIQ